MEKQLNRLQNTAHHIGRLLDAMGGSGEGWEYTGVCSEDTTGRTKCVCGHAIRYQFELSNGQKSIIVGSVCVDTAPGLSPDCLESVHKSLEALKQAKKEQERLVKEAAQSEEIAQKIIEMNAIQNSLEEVRTQYKADRRYMPYSIYTLKRLVVERISAKTKRGIISRINRHIEYLRYVEKTYKSEEMELA